MYTIFDSQAKSQLLKEKSTSFRSVSLYEIIIMNFRTERKGWEINKQERRNHECEGDRMKRIGRRSRLRRRTTKKKKITKNNNNNNNRAHLSFFLLLLFNFFPSPASCFNLLSFGCFQLCSFFSSFYFSFCLFL